MNETAEQEARRHLDFSDVPSELLVGNLLKLEIADSHQKTRVPWQDLSVSKRTWLAEKGFVSFMKRGASRLIQTWSHETVTGDSATGLVSP
jgi:hypothetical protein